MGGSGRDMEGGRVRESVCVCVCVFALERMRVSEKEGGKTDTGR